MFHEALSHRRKKLGMSVDQLAEKSGIPKSTLAKVLTGANPNPTLETIKSIAYALNMSLDELVAESDCRFSDSATRIAALYDSTSDQGRELLNTIASFVENNF